MSGPLPPSASHRHRPPPPHLPQEIRDLISSHFDSARDLVNSIEAFKGVWEDHTTSFAEPDWVGFMERPEIKWNVVRNAWVRARLFSIYSIDIGREITALSPTADSLIADKLPVPCVWRYTQIRRRRKSLNISKRELDDAIADEKPRLYERVFYSSRSRAEKASAFRQLLEHFSTDRTLPMETWQSCLAFVERSSTQNDSSLQPRLCIVHDIRHCQKTMIDKSGLNIFGLSVSAAPLASGAIHSWLVPYASEAYPQDQYFTNFQGNMIAQLFTGDTQASWHELVVDHA
ncbi:hypothetical protein Slin14017_G130130 [Septoria linicola]|nr:hypothetical protein Slin14017_G130130 [Septoria linicola]